VAGPLTGLDVVEIGSFYDSEGHLIGVVKAAST
jgi:hypothetical protein